MQVLNNVVEQDYRFIKCRILNELGFKEFESTKIALSGTEVLHMLRKNHIANSRITMFKSFWSLAA